MLSKPNCLIYCDLKPHHEPYCIIRVKDQDLEFTDEDKKVLFKKCQKLSAKPQAIEASSGLGLAIVASLAGKLNRTIRFESELGVGSTYC